MDAAGGAGKVLKMIAEKVSDVVQLVYTSDDIIRSRADVRLAQSKRR